MNPDPPAGAYYAPPCGRAGCVGEDSTGLRPAFAPPPCQHTHLTALATAPTGGSGFRLLVPALACLLLLVGCSSLEGTGDKGYISGDGQVRQIKPADRGEPIELAGDGLDGEEVDLADRRGKPTVLVVWASWCSPCRAEANDVADAAEELEGTAHFVGINTRDDESRAVAFVRSKRVPYPSIVDQDGEAMLAFPGTLTPRTIPAFVVLDEEGRIAASIIGQLPSKLTLVQLAEEVAAEQADGPADG